MRRGLREVVLITAMLCPCAQVGCAIFSADRRADTGGEDLPKSSPASEARARSRRLLDEAREAALMETERERSYVVKVRYNPGRCGAPGEEIFAYGGWRRVALVGRNERTELTLSEWRARAQDEPLRHQTIEGRWDEREWVAASGVAWPVFRVDELLEVEAARTPPDPSSSATLIARSSPPCAP